MLAQEALVEIHVLHRQGESIRSIAQKPNLSRNTVRRYLLRSNSAAVNVVSLSKALAHCENGRLLVTITLPCS